MFLDDIYEIKKNQIQKSKQPYKNVFESVNKNKINIIAEIKKASPSLGDINLDIDINSIAKGYIEAGARAISVLTETEYFKGNIEYIRQIRQNNKDIIILRKDFVIDPYQIYEAKFYGADMVLLIFTLTGFEKTKELAHIAKSIGLEALIEVHSEDEIKKALEIDCNFIGVNNRNLKTLKTTLETSYELSKYISEDKIFITESGIKNSDDIIKLNNIGYKGFLIGTSLMQTNNPSQALKNLIKGVE